MLMLFDDPVPVEVDSMILVLRGDVLFLVERDDAKLLTSQLILSIPCDAEIIMVTHS